MEENNLQAQSGHDNVQDNSKGKKIHNDERKYDIHVGNKNHSSWVIHAGTFGELSVIAVVAIVVIFAGLVMVIQPWQKSSDSKPQEIKLVVEPSHPSHPPTPQLLLKTSDDGNQQGLAVEPSKVDSIQVVRTELAPSPPVSPANDLRLELYRIEPDQPDVRHRENSFEVGERLSLTIEVSKDGYLYVLAVEADGNLVHLFPNKEIPTNSYVKAGQILHLPEDMPETANMERLSWPMHIPETLADTTEVTESVIAFLSPIPRKMPDRLGKIADKDFRSRGPRPQLIPLEDGSVIGFQDLPCSAVHYTIHRNR